MKTFALLIATFFFVNPLMLAHAEIYRWVDENGNVRFSDRKPAERESEDLTEQLGTVNVTESQGTGDYGAFLPETPQEKAADAQKKQEKQREFARRQKDCALARANLKKIQGPVYFERADGTQYDITEEERVRREEKLRQAIKKFCK
ncbi:DUF4124 domain-containing protein [Sessilibacter corallicola]|uniref:DUF4124 domain-containing protein n=1 Tax=Sessilibacter corallicola TaxID=2904075 RepID=A0ABQ0A6Y8_9GAMM|nr:DUF4124 domain-containing protein [Sessilibacter corallicola]MCE2028479.1 DUF4124 domain-containing protein [Sessilibacter corallicola]